MTFQQFRYLIEIAKYNSFSQAAAALYVTQPNLSKSMRDLEKELHISIFIRTNKGVVLTADGEQLLLYAKAMIEQTEAIQQHFKQSSHEKKVLAIASQHFGFVDEALTYLMDDLRLSTYELSIREGKTSDILQLVSTGQCAVGILSVSALNKHYFARHFQSKGLHFTSLATVQPHVFLRNTHPLAQFNTITYEQLQPYPFLSYQQQDTLLHLAEEKVALHHTEQIVYVQERATMNNLLAHTNGYSIGTGRIIPHFMNGEICARTLDDDNLIDIGFIKRHDTTLTADMVQFIEHVQYALARTL